VHIPDGLLPAQVCIAGYGITGLATWYSLRNINRKANPSADMPKASLLTAAFFVASSIYVPVPPVSVHLVLNGLLGVILGYFSFPAILIGLCFQALIIGHGGLTTLGINAAMMGIPALVAYHLFQLRQGLSQQLEPRVRIGVFAFIGGAVGLGLAVILFLTLVITTLPTGFDVDTEQRAIMTLSIAHIPLALIEGSFTSVLALFLLKVKPELLEG
jgi:cobalt/nickel transport system permease protein